MCQIDNFMNIEKVRGLRKVHMIRSLLLSQVQTVLRRHWNLQRMQFAGTFANADFFRSASYVASSLTEVHRCYSIESHTEHTNGRSYSDIFRSDSPFV